MDTEAESCTVDSGIQTDYEWVMTAKCLDESADSAGSHAWLMVICDLWMVWIIWILLLILEPMMKVVDTEVEDNMITASDFTV